MKMQKEIRTLLRDITSSVPSEKICKIRTEACLVWYTKKAITYKRFYYGLSIINVGIPIVVSIVLGNSGSTFWGATLSAIASFSAALLALFSMRDKWIIYRTAAEYIKSQYTLYCAGAMPYHDNGRHTKYLMVLESYMSSVHGQWYAIEKSQKEHEKVCQNNNTEEVREK